jgi:signal recognition particle receptor subunit beta
MALFNYATKEITIKIVYYGPGLSGKTTNLQYLHSIFDPAKRGKLLSLATEADRTLFFDFLPIELGKISDFSIRFQLYTVPGQVRYNATRKLVLKGADAIVFIADSQRVMSEQNIESLKNMHENLIANSINPDDIPVILQFNKRDLPNILSVNELNKDLNGNMKYEYREAVAVDGKGVEDTFKHITKLVINGIAEKHKVKIQTVEPQAPREEEKKPLKEPDRHPAEPMAAAPVIEPLRYESPPIEQTAYEPSSMREPFPSVITEEHIVPKEVIVKEIREVPAIPIEKVVMIIEGITEITQNLKELKSIVSNIHAEMKDIKKEQKESSGSLRQLMRAIDDLKTKKSWFRFW